MVYFSILNLTPLERATYTYVIKYNNKQEFYNFRAFLDFFNSYCYSTIGYSTSNTGCFIVNIRKDKLKVKIEYSITTTPFQSISTGEFFEKLNINFLQNDSWRRYRII